MPRKKQPLEDVLKDPTETLPEASLPPPEAPKPKKRVRTPPPPPQEPVEGGRNNILPPSLGRFQPQEAPQVEDYNALAELFNPGNDDKSLDARSDVNDLQIIHMSRARSIATHFRITKLNAFVDDVLRLSISRNRKSRMEFVRAFQSANMGENEATASIWNNLTQKLRG